MDKHIAMKIDEHDNVAIAVEAISSGETIRMQGEGVRLVEDIPFGHKFALQTIRTGEKIVKYGAPIGRATREIGAGEWVHTHNMESNLDGLEQYEYRPEAARKEDVSGVRDRFDGYLRQDGTVGIRNELWIVPTVSCVNSDVRRLAEAAQNAFAGRATESTRCPTTRAAPNWATTIRPRSGSCAASSAIPTRGAC
jgi:altronate hydrolase